MQDILKQIQSLKEDFMNLIEVEGLGQPASDVPPTTNKIKKDRKTKDGKVELVSVEDELFPYEGNKREQYRQKILDTINNMIQGTATLEDLLQIVRQKKAPLKEAMEILEKYTEAQKKSAAEKAFPKRKEELNKVADELDDIMKKNDYEYSGDIHIAQPKGWPYGKSQLNKDVEDKIGEYKRVLNRAHAAKKVSEAPLKEAMEVLEELIGEGYNLHQVVARAHAKKGSRFFKGDGLPKVSVSPEDIEKEERLAKILGDKEKTSELAKKALETPDSKEYKKHVSGDSRNLFVGGNTDSNLGRADRVALSQDVNGERAEKRQINKSIGRHYRKEQKKAPLKEAMELMETALDAIKKSDYSDEKKRELRQSLAKASQAEKEMADKKAWDSYIKGERKYSDTTVARDSKFTKNANGDRATRLRSARNNFDDHGWQKIKPEWKQVEDSIKRHEKKVRKNSSLKEAMEVLEELINEGRNLEDVVVRGYNKGKVSLDDLQKLMDKAHEVPSDSSYFHKSKGEKGELRTKHRHMDYERNVLSDGWGKDDNKKIEASIKRKAKNDKSFPVFQALKAYKEGKADIKEALSLMEAVINELHPDTVNNALDKRTEQSIEADDKERDEFNNILKIKDRDERAKAYKEFKKKADDRFAKEDKKLDLYFNYAKRHPELVKESLRDQIDKKVKAGEINLDKALKLDKKIEDKMSSEKNAQEYSDELDKRAKKERLGDRAVAKSIRRNERKGACEALELAEAIINEVSLKTWKEAAKNSIDKRKEAAENTAKTAEQSWDDYEEFSRKHPEEEDALYKRAWRNDIIAKKAEDRADHASDVLGIKAKGKSANKTIKAARNSETKRNDEYLQNSDPDKFNRLRTRMMKSDQLITADPVKSRAYESLEEALRLLEGLFVNDGRGDLIDNDIMNKPGWTRKTIENGITRVAKGCQKKVNNKEK